VCFYCLLSVGKLDKDHGANLDTDRRFSCSFFLSGSRIITRRRPKRIAG
jgi:hypothetical protein